MARSRWLVAVVGLLASLAASAVIWWVFDVPFLFLFVPFVPYLLVRGRRSEPPPARTCPRCGFSTRDPDFRYCPRDGARLEGDGAGGRRR